MPQTSWQPPARISAGLRHAVALLPDGRVVASGTNERGQCDVPVLGGNRSVIGVAAGVASSFALFNDGKLAAWGKQTTGDLPDFGGQKVVSMAAGSGCVALLENGTMFTWSVVTSRVIDAGQRVAAVAAGFAHHLALLCNGTVRAWGLYQPGGDAFVPHLPKRAISVAGGSSHSIAAFDDGSVALWGSSLRGQEPEPDLGGRRAVAVAAGPRHSAVLLADGSVLCIGDSTQPLSWAPRRAVSVSCGDLFTIAQLDDGTVVGWGENKQAYAGIAQSMDHRDAARSKSGCCTTM